MPEQEATAITGSIVLAADDPAALARFYGALLDMEPQPGLSSTHWRVRWPAGGWLEVYAPSKSRPQPGQRGRLRLHPRIEPFRPAGILGLSRNQDLREMQLIHQIQQEIHRVVIREPVTR